MTDKSFASLINLYKDMDTAWDTVAKAYSFQCSGCTDNCCKSLFYHHTHIERAYLLHGFRQLPLDRQRHILTLANEYCEKTFHQENSIKSLKILCPVNENGQCLLYPYRPMICRLHGLPHELNPPGYEPIKGPGCKAGQFEIQPYIPFDRTPFYQQMARIESDFRQHQNQSEKMKMTVAQMLLWVPLNI
ncbi:MAG: hypothetical protein ABIJ31_11785 [Pseudomonadota bacterium]